MAQTRTMEHSPYMSPHAHCCMCAPPTPQQALALCEEIVRRVWACVSGRSVGDVAPRAHWVFCHKLGRTAGHKSQPQYQLIYGPVSVNKPKPAEFTGCTSCVRHTTLKGWAGGPVIKRQTLRFKIPHIYCSRANTDRAYSKSSHQLFGLSRFPTPFDHTVYNRINDVRRNHLDPRHMV